MKKLLLPLFLLATFVNACALNGVDVRVPNVRKCHVKDRLLYGANCVDTNTGLTSELTYDEARSMIEYQPASPGNPGHAPGVFMTLEDAKAEAEALDEMCRALGDHCSLEAQQYAASLHLLIESAQAVK